MAVSDVVVENFSPRVMAKYGLNYERLVEIRPDIIMASMPGFGHSGPHRDFASYGGPLMAYTGMALLWGYDRFASGCAQQDRPSRLHRLRRAGARRAGRLAPPRPHRRGTIHRDGPS